MLQENGKNTFNEKALIRILELARNSFKFHNYNNFAIYLKMANYILKKAKNINEILTYEAICLDLFDTNILNNNVKKISNKLVACNIARHENILFEENKDKYLDNFLSSRVSDIMQDSAFEKSCKEIIIHLGIEKRSALIDENIFAFIEIRQNNLKNIIKEFSSKRKAFLSKYIQ